MFHSINESQEIRFHYMLGVIGDPVIGYFLQRLNALRFRFGMRIAPRADESFLDDIFARRRRSPRQMNDVVLLLCTLKNTRPLKQFFFRSRFIPDKL